MAKQTQQEKIIDWFLSRGSTETKCRSGKYRQFTSSKPKYFYFVGRKGAVRAGQCASKSFSITDRIKYRMGKENV